MKTLDEVIESITKRSGLEIRNVNKPDKDRFWVDRETYMDALHYLRNYRENQHAYEEGNRKAEEARERYLEAVKNCELAENKYKRLYGETSQKLRNTSQITCPKCHSEFVILPESNNALTWDELRTMEGKPVWVEVPDKIGHWDIVRDVGRIYENEDRDEWMWFYIGDKKPKVMYGKWQAYRKEREDER